MARNIEMRVYLNIDELNKIKDAGETRKIQYKTDSELIRKILYDYQQKIMNMVDADTIIKYRMNEFQQKMAEKETIISNMQQKIMDLSRPKKERKEQRKK